MKIKKILLHIIHSYSEQRTILFIRYGIVVRRDDGVCWEKILSLKKIFVLFTVIGPNQPTRLFSQRYCNIVMIIEKWWKNLLYHLNIRRQFLLIIMRCLLSEGELSFWWRSTIRTKNTETSFTFRLDSSDMEFNFLALTMKFQLFQFCFASFLQYCYYTQV